MNEWKGSRIGGKCYIPSATQLMPSIQKLLMGQLKQVAGNKKGRHLLSYLKVDNIARGNSDRHPSQHQALYLAISHRIGSPEHRIPCKADSFVI